MIDNASPLLQRPTNRHNRIRDPPTTACIQESGWQQTRLQASSLGQITDRRRRNQACDMGAVTVIVTLKCFASDGVVLRRKADLRQSRMGGIHTRVDHGDCHRLAIS
tara:strand:+ start:4648 stop:4968 length:321 start_codon:yes stop_codon:yes gene_type:complete